MIISSGFELESPNLHQICILGYPQVLLKMGAIGADLRGYLAISTQEMTLNSLLYTDLGQPRGVTCPKCGLVYFFYQWSLMTFLGQWQLYIVGFKPDFVDYDFIGRWLDLKSNQNS